MANALTFEQSAAILNEVQAQATGKGQLADINETNFATVADTTLKTGPDTVLKALSQVMDRTIFSQRPYEAKFKGLEVTASDYGNHTRKVNIADKQISDDSRYSLVDGESVDQQKVNAPVILQTNFYGSDVYEDSYTVYRDQLNQAFSGPEEFARFVSMIVGNMSDKLEQYRENTARNILGNAIAATRALGLASQNIHLLTEYNAVTGLELTATDVYKPENFPAFAKWAYARIASISDLMTERSEKFQNIITVGDKKYDILRHTPKADQRVYIYSPYQHQFAARVLADTYHDSYMQVGDFELVNFFQSIDNPDTVQLIPNYTTSAGVPNTPAETATKVDNIFGVIFDSEALAYAITQAWSAPAPFNARGGYSNVFYHVTERNWFDNTEKFVLFTLD